MEKFSVTELWVSDWYVLNVDFFQMVVWGWDAVKVMLNVRPAVVLVCSVWPSTHPSILISVFMFVLTLSFICLDTCMCDLQGHYWQKWRSGLLQSAKIIILCKVRMVEHTALCYNYLPPIMWNVTTVHVCWCISCSFKDRNAPIMQQLGNVNMSNTNMGQAGANMNPMAVLQLLQSLQGLSTLAQLTSNLGGLGGNNSALPSGGGMGSGSGGSGMSDSSGANPLAALSGLGMLGSTLGLGGGGGGGGGGGSGMGGLGSSHHGDGGTSGRQVFVRNVSATTVY